MKKSVRLLRQPHHAECVRLKAAIGESASLVRWDERYRSLACKTSARVVAYYEQSIEHTNDP